MKTTNRLLLSVISAILVALSTVSIAVAASISSNATGIPTPAPGRGIIPAVSDHYKTMPSFYDIEAMPAQKINNNVSRRFIMGTESMIVRWDLKAGTKLPVHFHVNEQLSRVEKGTIEAYSQGQKYVLKPGNIMVFPPNVPHEFVALEDSILMEHFTPARQDFINGDFEKNMPPKVVMPAK